MPSNSLERHRVRGLPVPDEVHHGVVDAAVHGQEEVVRLKEGGNQMEGIVVDQEGAQQRVLGLHVVRRRPVPLSAFSAARRSLMRRTRWA